MVDKIAETLDKLRIVPRFLIFGYSYLVYDIVVWIKTVDEISAAETGVLTAIVGAGSLIFNFYVQTGSNRTEKKQQ